MPDRLPKRPGYLWYPGDARRDSALISLPLVVRGLWREMLDLMHDGDPYGHLTAGGYPMTSEDVARVVGEPVKQVAKWISQLEERQVFSRTDEGVIYSRRMVRDEDVRRVRADGGRGASQPNAKGVGKGIPKGGAKGHKTIPIDPPPALALAVADSSEDASAKCAQWLLDSYPQWYAEERNGARYQVRPAFDAPAAFSLVETWPNREHLERMCRLFLRADNIVSAHANRGLALFADKYASGCDAKLRERGAA
jgi:hypothetical protein